MHLDLSLLPQTFAICRLPPSAARPAAADLGEVWSLTRTPHELSIVLAEELAQPGWKSEAGWRALAVAGPLELSLVGILAELSGRLASAQVSVFALSTFDTDYLLVKAEDLGRAFSALADAGHRVGSND